jgi:hypothetical protein
MSEVCLSPRWTKEEHEKIEFLRNEYYRIGKELKEIVKPTDEEIKDLIEDLNLNREIYTSYMEEDPFFQSENIYDECNAQLEAEQDDKS